jgi:hypothetical protein
LKEVVSKPCPVTIYIYDTYQRLFPIKTISDDITGAAAANGGGDVASRVDGISKKGERKGERSQTLAGASPLQVRVM